MRKIIWLSCIIFLFIPSLYAQEDEQLYLRLSADNAEKEQLEAAIEVLEMRLDALDMKGEISLTKHGEIEIQLPYPIPEAFDPDTLVQIGLLEFVEIPSGYVLDPNTINCLLTTAWVENEFPQACDEEAELLTLDDEEPFLTIATGEIIDEAIAAEDENFPNRWYVVITFTEDGSDLFADYTEAHIGKMLAIVLDQAVIAAPYIQARIEGQAIITGNFTKEETEALASILESGALPIALTLEEVANEPAK